MKYRVRNTELAVTKQRSHRYLFFAAVTVIIIILASALVFLTLNTLRLPGASQSRSAPLKGTAIFPSPNAGWTRLWSLPPTAPNGSLTKPLIASSPASPRVLYLCRVALIYRTPLPPATLRVFYRSNDLGQHWTAFALPEPASSCSIEADPVISNAIVLLDDRGGNYMSKDAGQDWTRIPLPPGWPASSAFDLAVQPVDGRLYAGGYWTTDLQSWTPWSPHPAYSGSPQVVAVNPQRPNTIYTSCRGTVDCALCAGVPSHPAGTQNGLCRSDDDGHSWRFLISLALSLDASSPAFCMAAGNPTIISAWGFASQSSTGGTIRSTDGGTTWIALPPSLNGQFGDGPFDLCDFHRGENATVVDVVQPNGDSLYSFAITYNGTIFHAAQREETLQGMRIPAGVSLLRGSGWKQIAPSPLPDKLVAPYGLTIVWLSSILLAYDSQTVYRYTGPISR